MVFILQGPFVVIDKFVDLMMNLKLPDGKLILDEKWFIFYVIPDQFANFYLVSSELNFAENGVDAKNVDLGTQLSIDIALGRKRKTGDNDDSDEDDLATAPPAHDIYRQRQQKKVKGS